MIFGIGVDICDQERIAKTYERFGERFINKLCLPSEKVFVSRFNAKRKIQVLSKLFAYKEAAAKALGTGFTSGINLRSFSISYNNRGKPSLLPNETAIRIIKNSTQKKFNKKIKDNNKIIIHTSSSDDRNLAVAMVLIEIY